MPSAEFVGDKEGGCDETVGGGGDTSVWDPSRNSLPQINNEVDVSLSPIDLKGLHRTIAT